MIEEKLIHNKTDNVLYVHESFSSMFHGFLDWFQSQFEPRFAYKVISTYDKAVQFFTSKKMSKDGAVQTNILPSITLDPNLDFTNEDKAGRFLWMFSELDSYRQRDFTDQINLREQGVVVSINKTRYSGTCDVTFWLSSIYELMDFRSKLIQYCGGTGRWIRPKFFWTHIILPKEIVEFNRPDDDKKLDWSSTPLEVIQLNTTNSREYAVPYPLNAIWRLDSLSDGSTKYGADQLTEWRFTATFTWEANIPTFVRLDNYAYYDMHPTLSFHVSPAYSSQPLINNFKSLTNISRDDILKDYLKTNAVYIVDTKSKITDSETKEEKEVTDSPFVKFDDTQCQHFPDFYTNWNHIVSCKLYCAEDVIGKGMDISNEDFILLMDEYNSDIHDNLLRMARGCLCRYDDKASEFFTKISSLNLPTICNFDKKLYTALRKLQGTDITMDSISKLIYSGLHKSIQLDAKSYIDKEHYTLCNNIIDFISKHKNVDECDKSKELNFGYSSYFKQNREDNLGKLNDDKEVDIPYLLCVKNTDDIKVYADSHLLKPEYYEIIGKRIRMTDKYPFNKYANIILKVKGLTKIASLELAINYQMTKTDERNYLTEGKRIEIEIPEGFEKEYIKCCSYNGILDEHSDYEVVDNKIVFKLEPMRDKVIQVFANRS